MCWSHLFIIGLLLQSFFIFNVDGNAYHRRHRRQRRQTSGSLYGTNAHLGASAPAGYNYPASYSIQGTRLNNPDARMLNLNGNPLILPSVYNPGNRLTSLDLNSEPRPQQQQTYGTNDEAVLNYYFSGNSFPSGLAPSFYPSSDLQQAYPVDPNQVGQGRDFYGASSNRNNMNNYQYPYNQNNQLPNSNNYGNSINTNTYRDPMGPNANQLPNSNSYGGPSGSNTNQVPNSNTYGGYSGGGSASLIPDSNSYSGYLGTIDNTEAWQNNNNNLNYNRFNSNPSNSYYPNRDMNYNYNNYNRYGNGYYNQSNRLIRSIEIFFLSLLLPMILH